MGEAAGRARGGRAWRPVAAALAALVLAGCETPAPEVVYRDAPARAPEVVYRDAPACTVARIDTQNKYAVEAWGVPDARFAVGEPLTLQMRLGAPAYVTLFHVSSSCKVTRLLDNARMPMAQILDYPAKGGGLSISVKPPGGREGFYFIATLERLAFLSPGDVLSESGGIASIDMSPAQFYARLEQARARMDPASWGVTTLRTEVVEH